MAFKYLVSYLVSDGHPNIPEHEIIEAWNGDREIRAIQMRIKQRGARIKAVTWTERVHENDGTN